METNKAIEVLNNIRTYSGSLADLYDENPDDEQKEYMQNKLNESIACNMGMNALVKLDKIEQIVAKSYTEDEMYCALVDIKKVLESEE